MKKIEIRKHKHLLFGFACGFALVGMYALGSKSLTMYIGSPVVSAAIPATPDADPYLRGWAWSSNIGWISFDCRDLDPSCAVNAGGNPTNKAYATKFDLATGKISGPQTEHFAWASNIGWIDTNPTAGYPAAPNHGLEIDPATGVVSGWMRACAGAANMKNTPPRCTGGSVDGWDGWIKVTNAKVSQGGVIKNAVAYDTYGAETTGGWMWGDDVVGWVKTWMGGGTGVTFPAADCSFAADPAAVTPPQTTTLSWACNTLVQQNTCAIDHGVGSGLGRSGSRNANPTESTTYTLTCQGLGGPVVKTANVNVSGTVRIIEVGPGR